MWVIRFCVLFLFQEYFIYLRVVSHREEIASPDLRKSGKSSADSYNKLFSFNRVSLLSDFKIYVLLA